MKKMHLPESHVEEGLLHISQGTLMSEPPDGAGLLLGFWFGVPPDHPINQQIVPIGLRPLARSTVFEGWWYRGPIKYSRRLAVRTAECEHYTAAVVQRKEADPTALKDLARQAYIDLFKALDASRHNNVVRIWNYFSDINGGHGDHERYRQFSIGRAEAFEELGFTDEYSPPGTAIGTVCGDTLSVIALACDSRFQRLENPRQMSAYRYPRRYGPRSPKFSRGGVVSFSNHDLILLSGTAAIVGHESAHPDDSAAQTAETLRNIEALLANSGFTSSSAHLDAIRVYLRNPEDFEVIAKELAGELGSTGVELTYLQGEICRPELLVEIDGAFCCRRDWSDA